MHDALICGISGKRTSGSLAAPPDRELELEGDYYYRWAAARARLEGESSAEWCGRLVAHPPTSLFLPRPPIVFLATFRLATTTPLPPHHLSTGIFQPSIFTQFEAQLIAYYIIVRPLAARFSLYLYLSSVSQAPNAATKAGALRVRPPAHCAIPAPAASHASPSFTAMRA